MQPAEIMSIIILVWLSVVGGCIGSFLNVVIYRLPLGRSIVRPPSACPYCGHAIRWYHNLPVLGWLLIGGRCYDCRAKISARYPLVELFVGGVFFALAWQIFHLSAQGPLAILDWRLWAVFVSLAGTFCALLCVLLIRYDGQRVPRGIWVAMGLFALLFALGPWW
ncbi:MAG: prepilin peptidase [Planctomycetia bacterium]|nr:prepilin peptidase [Planctomycetia bacterium]